MKAKFFEHILSILLVTALMAAAGLILGSADRAALQQQSKIIPPELRGMCILDISGPFERALLRDALDIYYPGAATRNDSIAAAIERVGQEALSDALQRSHVRERLTLAKIAQIGKMYIKFLLVYILVMGLTYYGVETIGLWRFVRMRRIVERSPGSAETLLDRGAEALGSAVRFAASLILFSPAYVIAYSIRTEFSVNSTVLMIVLAVISNGLLIVYSNRFYCFLVAESRKGYIETARAKNLGDSYLSTAKRGISLKAILQPGKRFEGHVLGHIFPNARLQYISSIKEQACFVITGLIIIEMALNIHGHLSYEMLRQLLYRNIGIVVVITLSIFYTVKATEMTIDGLLYLLAKRYGKS